MQGLLSVPQQKDMSVSHLSCLQSLRNLCEGCSCLYVCLYVCFFLMFVLSTLHLVGVLLVEVQCRGRALEICKRYLLVVRWYQLKCGEGGPKLTVTLMRGGVTLLRKKEAQCQVWYLDERYSRKLQSTLPALQYAHSEKTCFKHWCTSML